MSISTLESIVNLREFVCRRTIGQDRLAEGAPGLAKTRAIKVLSEGIGTDFHRLQFTPDLLPADLTGTEIYRPQDGSFVFQQGPLFNNLVLAEKFAHQATHDELTGLANRKAFEKRLTRVIDSAHSEHSLAIVDLDQLKIINDACGYTAGDEVLRQIAAC